MGIPGKLSFHNILIYPDYLPIILLLLLSLLLLALSSPASIVVNIQLV